MLGRLELPIQVIVDIKCISKFCCKADHLKSLITWSFILWSTNTLLHLTSPQSEYVKRYPYTNHPLYTRRFHMCSLYMPKKLNLGDYASDYTIHSLTSLHLQLLMMLFGLIDFVFLRNLQKPPTFFPSSWPPNLFNCNWTGRINHDTMNTVF